MSIIFLLQMMGGQVWGVFDLYYSVCVCVCVCVCLCQCVCGGGTGGGYHLIVFDFFLLVFNFVLVHSQSLYLGG